MPDHPAKTNKNSIKRSLSPCSSNKLSNWSYILISNYPSTVSSGKNFLSSRCDIIDFHNVVIVRAALLRADVEHWETQGGFQAIWYGNVPDTHRVIAIFVGVHRWRKRSGVIKYTTTAATTCMWLIIAYNKWSFYGAWFSHGIIHHFSLFSLVSFLFALPTHDASHLLQNLYLFPNTLTQQFSNNALIFSINIEHTLFSPASVVVYVMS